MTKQLSKIFLLLMMSLHFHAPVNAQENTSQTLFDGSSLVMYGAGVYTDLGEDIYIAALYVPLKDYEIKLAASKKMEMRIAAQNVSARRFTGLWLDAISLSSTRDERTEHITEIQQFGKIFRENMIRGDHVSFDYIEERDMTVILLNDVLAGEIPGAGFNHILLNSWIGNPALNAQLKMGILNKLPQQESMQIKQSLAELRYTETRYAEIENKYAQPDTADQSEALLLEEAAAALAEVESQQEQARQEAERLAKLAAEQELVRQEKLAAEVKAAEAAEAAEQARRLQEAEARALAERERLEAEQIQLAREYQSGLVRWLSSHVQYPERALANRLEGRVELAVLTDRNGDIVSESIISSSGSALLDQAALKMLEKGKPLPKMPDGLAGETFSFTMPVNFSL